MTAFHNGEEMWIHYNKGIFYNPFENLHLAANTRFKELKENQGFNIENESHQELIIFARDLAMRIQIQDLYDAANDHVFEMLEEEQPTLAETWDGPSEEQIKEIFEEYINLLDPLTMNWIRPNLADYYKGKYQWTHTTPINELDLTFIYEGENDRETWHGVYEHLSETIWNMKP